MSRPNVRRSEHLLRLHSNRKSNSSLPPSPPENATIEPFDVEYYRTLSGGIPGELFKTAMFVPELQPKKEKFKMK